MVRLGVMPSSNSNDGSEIGVDSNGGDDEKEALRGLAELSRYVPLRLSIEERALLAVLENTLHVSEYTDLVDVANSSYRRGQKARRILDGILEACHISTGLAVASGGSQEQQKKTLKSCFQTPEKNNNDDENNKNQEEKNEEDADESITKKNKKVTKKGKKKRGAIGGRRRRLYQDETEPLDPSKDVASRAPKQNAALFQTMFEIGRRNKVLNPSQMRTTYGKLMYLLQDAQSPSVAKSLGFSLHKDLLLVGSFLEEHDCADLMHDTRLVGATQFVPDRDESTGVRLSREHVDARVKEKRQLLDQLVTEYSAKSKLSSDDVRRAIESIGDAVAYIESNVAPVKKMLNYLKVNFDPTLPEDGFSLELRSTSRYSTTSSSYSRYGLSAFSSSAGPTLSHSHATQYTFVYQSLKLWCKVQKNMHKLWVCADDDLLSTSTSYHLYNTGQGLNRVQSCPKVGRVMRALLQQTQKETGSNWVGLSVIHLGDRDVPNALVFIDKYTQIPRFLNPLVSFLQGLPELCRDPIMEGYVRKQFGSLQNLKMEVLCDYFKHGFDGSGDDGGSCIDGRLTSSWNWTSRIAKKPYYHAFMLSGFQGFDGDFK